MIDAPPQLGDFLCFAIYSANHAFSRVYKPLLEELGLTYPQYLVMSVLWGADGQTVGQIGGHLFLESNTLTPLLKRLERAGYLKRERDPADERVVRACLTARGTDLQRRAGHLPKCALEASGRSAEDAQRLKHDIEQLRAALGDFSTR